MDGIIINHPHQSNWSNTGGGYQSTTKQLYFQETMGTTQWNDHGMTFIHHQHPFDHDLLNAEFNQDPMERILH
jgi:hypothetical protein